MSEAADWPVEIALLKAERKLSLSYADGSVHDLPADLLRVESPSAEVQGHGPGQKTLVAGKSRVGISALEPVGHYAIRILFDDGHDTGIFTWRYLRELGDRQAEIWQAYQAALAEAGLGRDP